MAPEITAEPDPLTATEHPDIEREGKRPETTSQREHSLIERVADDKSGEPTEDDQQAALDYLVRAFNEEIPDEELQDKLWVNVGTPRKPHKILWIIRPLERHEIRRIEESVANRRDIQAGRAASPDLRYQTSLRIVTEGTVVPDLFAGAKTIGLASPGDFLEEALKKKSGLIEQLAGEVYGLSGYDQADVQDATEVTATGN
jgi:hypothetical protein